MKQGMAEVLTNFCSKSDDCLCLLIMLGGLMITAESINSQLSPLCEKVITSAHKKAIASACGKVITSAHEKVIASPLEKAIASVCEKVMTSACKKVIASGHKR